MRRGDQKSPKQIKSEIEISKDKLFFINRIVAGSTQAKWYLVQVDMDHSDTIEMRDFEVYQHRWYIKHHEDCTQHRTMEFRFWLDF